MLINFFVVCQRNNNSFFKIFCVFIVREKAMHRESLAIYFHFGYNKGIRIRQRAISSSANNMNSQFTNIFNTNSQFTNTFKTNLVWCMAIIFSRGERAKDLQSILRVVKLKHTQLRAINSELSTWSCRLGDM